MAQALRGVYTALVTPFQEDGAVDYPALTALVERQVAAGVDGVVPCGTTGESPTLSHEEFGDVIECVVRAAKRRVQVVAGVGTNSTDKTIANAREAAERGVDAIMVVNPYYNKPPQSGLFEHFSAVAQAVALPVMLYNIPGRTGVTLENETIRHLRAEHDNIAAVKHATGKVDDAAALMNDCDIAVLSGDDPITLPLMSLGAVGVVSVVSNLVPRAVKQMVDAALQDDYRAAREAHRRLWPLATALLGLSVNPLPIKTALALKGLCRETFRRPLTVLSGEQREKLERVLGEMRLEL